MVLVDSFGDLLAALTDDRQAHSLAVGRKADSVVDRVPPAPERTVMRIMGWSSTAMAARYQHVTDPIRHVVAAQVGGLLWADAGQVRDAN